MAGEDSADELIEIVVRLPRATIEQSIQATRDVDEATPGMRRLALAKALLAGQRYRATIFTGVRLCDPSWDMILELYVAACEGHPFKVTKLCVASGGAVTTALRHLEELEARGYVIRKPDSVDCRSNLVIMQLSLRQAIDTWLDFLTIKTFGMPVVGKHD